MKSPFEPHQIVCPDSSDRIVPPDELLASEAATVAGMQLAMLEKLLARAEVLRSRAMEASFYVASEAVFNKGGHYQDLAVDLSSDTHFLAQDLSKAIGEMVDYIKPIAESVLAKCEANIRSKEARRPPH